MNKSRFAITRNALLIGSFVSLVASYSPPAHATVILPYKFVLTVINKLPTPEPITLVLTGIAFVGIELIRIGFWKEKQKTIMITLTPFVDTR
jgi:hypothetical protein